MDAAEGRSDDHSTIHHDVQQGTGAWLRLREGFDTASERRAAWGVGRST